MEGLPQSTVNLVHEKGARQGNPVPAYLFIFFVEILSMLVNKKEQKYQRY